MENLIFRKTGAEVKAAISKQIEQLYIRLKLREDKIEELFEDKGKLKSYLIRSSVTSYGHYVQSYSTYDKNEVSREEVEEIDQICRRVHELKREINELKMVRKHLADEDVQELRFDQLVTFGFDPE